MTREDALTLEIGSRVFAHPSPVHDPDDEVAKVYNKIVTVKAVTDFHGDVMIAVEGCTSALYWDEIDFVQTPYVDDDLDESMAGNILELFGGDF